MRLRMEVNQTSKLPLYRRYGLLLGEICKRNSLNKKSLHIALKKSKNIESLRDLSRRELYEYLIEIEAFFASEYGIELLGEESETLTEQLKRENDG